MDFPKELGDSGFKIITAVVNKIYISGDWPKDFLDVTVTAWPKKNQAKKCSNHRIFARIPSKRIEIKMLRNIGVNCRELD